MVSEASWLSPSQLQLSSADLLDQSSPPHLQGCSQFCTSPAQPLSTRAIFSEQYHPDNPASGLLWTEEKTVWWCLYSSQIYWQRAGPRKTDLLSSTTSKKRCITDRLFPPWVIKILRQRWTWLSGVLAESNVCLSEEYLMYLDLIQV